MNCPKCGWGGLPPVVWVPRRKFLWWKWGGYLRYTCFRCCYKWIEGGEE